MSVASTGRQGMEGGLVWWKLGLLQTQKILWKKCNIKTEMEEGMVGLARDGGREVWWEQGRSQKAGACGVANKHLF